MKRIVAAIMIVSIVLSMFAIFTPKANSSNSLVGYWKFDEGSGTTASDSSGNGNTGTLVNGPAWVKGVYGDALSFDGASNYVQIPDSSSLDVTAQVTVEAWVYPRAYVDSAGYNSAIVARTDINGGHIYNLDIYPNSHKVSYSVNPSPFEQPSTADLALNAWTYLAMTYDGSYVSLYINGAFDSRYAQSGPIETTTNWLAIGCLPTGPYGGAGTYAYFNGIVDEVRIYNTALTQQEIQTDMGGASPPTQSSTSVVCSPNPASVGSPVTCTATVTGSSPTGTVTWSTSSATGSLSQSVCTLSNGTCSTTYTDKFTGSVTITASYSGDPNNMPSSSNTTLTVTSARAVQVSFSFQGNFSGSITNGFFDITSGTVTIGAFSYTFENGSPPGYSGTDFNDFHTSTSGDLFAGAINIGDGYVMGLAALYIQTGPTSLSVTFAYGGPPFPGSTAVTSAFDGQIVASINATGNLQASGSTFTLDATGETINAGAQSSTLVACLPNPAIVAKPVTCTAVVSGSSPTGTVTWSTSSSTGNFNQSVCNLINGTCSTTYVDNFIGSVTIVASYNGDPNNSPSSGSFALIVTSGGPVYYSSNYTSVQAAIDAAPPGATIIIAPGFYSESLVVNKTLTIIGEKDMPVFSGGASAIYLTLLSGASGSNITGIEITNVAEGILVDNASNCSIYGNIMDSVGCCGIVVEGNNAADNVIYGNIFQDTPTPINLTASAGNNTIYGNIITSQTSVTLNIVADGNAVYGNIMSGSQILLNLTDSKDNIFYHNNFMATDPQITVLASGNNTWDDGHPSGGNYWSITPQFVGSNNTDRYPLTKPWPIATGHCVAVISVVTAKAVIGQGLNCRLTVYAADNGEYAESFNVSAYANNTAIGTQQVSGLNASCQMVLMFAWNTTSLAYGNYTISAYAQPVANQTDTSGDTFTLGTLKVTIPGDINGDFKVGLPDLVILAQAYGSKPGDSNWNANADIDGNGAVGLSDLVILAQHYGQHYP